MSHGATMTNEIQTPTTTAAEAREHLAELEAERVLARTTGVAEIAVYMLDLERELEAWHRRYVTAAVTEVAVLNACLSAERYGANFG
jgi:hypothetical protein